MEFHALVHVIVTINVFMKNFSGVTCVCDVGAGRVLPVLSLGPAEGPWE